VGECPQTSPNLVYSMHMPMHGLISYTVKKPGEMVVIPVADSDRHCTF